MSRALLFSFTKKDFRVDWYRASGPGGQKVNKTSSACRITHKETGLHAQCQESRSAYANRKTAFKKLTDLLVAHYAPKLDKARGPLHEKATRTYHEPRDTVTDHVTGERFSYRQTVGRDDLSLIIENRIDKAPRE